ncbi:PREDICTED: cGMP-inhibited 3',5'-cyclic phosphodiesterase B-like [Priapulus caudatus]|uniref:cGMP-inhibited 3',5'-cyclic phosphodiesterase B-like n=1 Tax=Priapulus caudatus TaxID=37621 RepID=A0ABM1E3T6_PRICU|nr:PREDICTED: cGMP-inhibited 3',5'-cyclic phosphodiesterase B-like [Priapulus caudatus]
MAKPSTSRTPRDEQEQENNGYVHVLVTPLECSGLNVSQWFGLTHIRLTTQQRHLLTTGVCLLGAILVYWLVTLDLGLILQRICSVIVPLFSISSAFYWLPVYFRRSWNAASVYMLFIACFGGEIVGQTMSVRTDSYLASPVLLTAVLGSVGLANTFSSLDSRESAAVISFVSVIRFVAVTLLTEIPKGFRPFVAYVCGALGVVLANHMETMMRPAGGSGLVMHDAKIPAVKRRRTSSSGNGPPAFNHRGRRTSLPALGLIQKNQVQASTSSYDMALMGEAHGLITDMLANPDLPPTIVSGLRAVANLLNPPKHFTHNFQKPKMSPLLSLTETLNSSDTEENPYTGERPSSFPRRLRRRSSTNLAASHVGVDVGDDDVGDRRPTARSPSRAAAAAPPSGTRHSEPGRVIQEVDGVIFNLDQMDSCESVNRLSDWNYQIFDLNMRYSTTILSRLSYKVFQDVGLFETFKIPVKEFLSYFHAVEMGYHDKPYAPQLRRSSARRLHCIAF